MEIFVLWPNSQLHSERSNRGPWTSMAGMSILIQDCMLRLEQERALTIQLQRAIGSSPEETSKPGKVLMLVTTLEWENYFQAGRHFNVAGDNFSRWNFLLGSRSKFLCR